MSETTPAPDSQIQVQVDATLLAFDYALKRFKQENLANWRSPVQLPPAILIQQAHVAITRCGASLFELGQ
jgi:hypothetical protein